MRTQCKAKKNTNREKWKASFHRRKWLQRVARKEAKGDLTANHTAVQVIEARITKWLCTTCGAYAGRFKDLGNACKGPPAKGICRYWKKQDSTLEAYRHNRDLTAGRNNTRTGIPDQPPEDRRIIRLLGAQAEEPPTQQGPGDGSQGPAQVQKERSAPKKGPRKKLIPSQVMADHEGPRLTVSQELARILCKKHAEAPGLTQDEFPSLPSGGVGPGTSAAGSKSHGTAATQARPRSRSPRVSVWSGAKGKHLEGGRQQVIQWPRQVKGVEPKQVAELQSQGQLMRKRQNENRRDQTLISTQEEPRNPKSQRVSKERVTQAKEAIAAGKKTRAGDGRLQTLVLEHAPGFARAGRGARSRHQGNYQPH